MIRRRKSQSVLEYVIVLTLIIGTVIAGVSMLGLNADKTVNENKGLGKLMDQVKTRMETESGKIANMGN